MNKLTIAGLVIGLSGCAAMDRTIEAENVNVRAQARRDCAAEYRKTYSTGVSYDEWRMFCPDEAMHAVDDDGWGYDWECRATRDQHNQALVAHQEKYIRRCTPKMDAQIRQANQQRQRKVYIPSQQTIQQILTPRPTTQQPIYVPHR